MSTPQTLLLKPLEDPLLPQMEQILAASYQALSRRQLPAFWNLVDTLAAPLPVPLKIQQHGRAFRTILSLISWTLGLFLAIPGLYSPREFFLPLIVGLVAWGYGSLTLLFLRPVLLSVLHLLLGLFLLVSACLRFSQFGVFLILGLPMLAQAIYCLCFRRKSPLQRLAESLRQRQNAVPVTPLVFDDQGLVLPDGTRFSYRDFTGIFVSEDLLAPVYDGKILFLPRPQSLDFLPPQLLHLL